MIESAGGYRNKSHRRSLVARVRRCEQACACCPSAFFPEPAHGGINDRVCSQGGGWESPLSRAVLAALRLEVQVSGVAASPRADGPLRLGLTP
jgi:hypothetical protein